MFNDFVKDRTKIINFLPLFKVSVEKNPENYIIDYGNYKNMYGLNNFLKSFQ